MVGERASYQTRDVARDGMDSGGVRDVIGWRGRQHPRGVRWRYGGARTETVAAPAGGLRQAQLLRLTFTHFTGQHAHDCAADGPSEVYRNRVADLSGNLDLRSGPHKGVVKAL